MIRKLKQVRENVASSQSRSEAIEIIEAVILALVAVATAWSGYQAAAGDRYVRITVLLATVLLITAIGQRFRVKVARIIFMILAWLLLCLPL